MIFLKMIFLLLFLHLLGCSSGFLPGFGQRPKEELWVTSSEARPSSPGTPWRCLLMAGPTQPENQGSTWLTHSSQVNSSLTHTPVWEEAGVPEENNLLPNTHTHTHWENIHNLLRKAPWPPVDLNPEPSSCEASFAPTATTNHHSGKVAKVSFTRITSEDIYQKNRLILKIASNT